MIFMNKVFQVTNNNCVALLDQSLPTGDHELTEFLVTSLECNSHDQVVEFGVFYHQLIDRQLLS